MNSLNTFLRQTSMFSRRVKPKKKSSLVRRFQALLICLGVAIYLISVAGFWISSNHVIQSTFKQQTMSWISALVPQAKSLFISQDFSSLSTVEAITQGRGEVGYVRFYAKDGRTIQAELDTGLTSVEAIPTFDADIFKDYTQHQLRVAEPLMQEVSLWPSLIQVSIPIYEETSGDALFVDGSSEVIGYVDIGLCYGAYLGLLVESVLFGSLFISCVFLVAAVAGRQLIQRSLRPLLELREPLDRLARGETDVWVSHEGDEEIVAISNALKSTIGAIKLRDAELRRLADYDSLTGLINKRSFDVVLENERKRVIKEHDSSALFYIDLDQFKYVNDTLGHEAGDRLLVQVAEMLKSRMRSDDVVSRIGGDEFIVLAKSVDREGALEIASAIVKAMCGFVFAEQGKVFNIYCSVGISLLEDNQCTADEVLSNADMACYTAKSQGRNRYFLFEAKAGANSRLDIGWSHRIAQALSNNNFMLHFQPIVQVDESDMPSFEVLLRMLDDDGGIIPPNMFIPIAERFGLLADIDYWVIQRSMEQLNLLNKQGKKVCLYVNLSGQLMDDPDFVERVLELKDELNIDARQMVFELTERAAVASLKAASIKMQKLRNHGFSFAVDDFGSGFSSFSYLKHMPVEFVKIEGEFVERIVDDEIDRAMVKSMIDVAKSCGKKVVAEYVCDENTFKMLVGFGIDYMQGFYIAEPASEPDFDIVVE